MESSNWYDRAFAYNMDGLFIGITSILIGYNNRSYVRGTSIQSQRNFIFIGGIIILVWFLFDFYRGYSGGY